MAAQQQKSKVQTAEDARLDGSQEIPEWAVPTPGEQELAQFRGVASSQWRRKLSGAELIKYVADCSRELDGREDEAMVLEIAAQIAAASTVDEVLSDTATIKGRETLDFTLAIDAIKFTESEHQDGCPYFAICRGRNTKTNESDTFTFGGWRVVLQLAWMHYSARELMHDSPYLASPEDPDAIERQTYPFFFKMEQIPTRSGRTMNALRSPMH